MPRQHGVIRFSPMGVRVCVCARSGFAVGLRTKGRGKLQDSLSEQKSKKKTGWRQSTTNPTECTWYTLFTPTRRNTQEDPHSSRERLGTPQVQSTCTYRSRSTVLKECLNEACVGKGVKTQHKHVAKVAIFSPNNIYLLLNCTFTPSISAFSDHAGKGLLVFGIFFFPPEGMSAFRMKTLFRLTNLPNEMQLVTQKWAYNRAFPNNFVIHADSL